MREKMGFGFWVAVVAITAVGLIVWGSLNRSRRTDASHDGKTSREVAFTCTTDMATEFHIHPVLKIVIDGTEETLPVNIGIENGCMHPLHTHDSTGIVHVESPVKRDFTLGDFFAVWGKEFTRDQILDRKADDTHTITMTVNGQAADSYENTVLKDKDEIVISYTTKTP